ncbi:Uracil phosphoribosyltransferase [Paramicrosporidium saccamoebae]|uniref:Uracil phosphoribosyltransferase n=1 Tax=Paramicrosporidium saccamoebae TaxID=1246581 RepID=A0A2H9TKG3_9FUNG|nr:Uracil phosphoribosyltransferase [Paramicrosporidium saccamoebae]
MLELIPTAPVLHIGIFREKTTLQPVEYYNKLPQSNSFDICYVLDPMIATGGTALATIEMLKDFGVPKIILLTICASEPGSKMILERHPDVEIYTAALDPELNAEGYIVPGLGDAGDRLYNTINN